MKDYTALNIYYKTDHWKTFSKSLLEDKNTRCEMCGKARWTRVNGDWKIANKFNVHHKNYKCLNFETRIDVMVLCEECHKRFHSKGKITISKTGKVRF